jgi:hypothetical protein
MSQTLTSLLAPLVCSTKNRTPVITPEIEYGIAYEERYLWN